MVGMGPGVHLHAFGAHELETDALSAEVCYGLATVLDTGDVVLEVALHVLDVECAVHLLGCLNLNQAIIIYFHGAPA